jgi:hypothetical protein
VVLDVQWGCGLLQASTLLTSVGVPVQAVALACQELDDVRRLLTTAEAELEGLRAALESATQRHAAQLQSERTAASQQLQRIRSDLMNRSRDKSALSADLERGLDEILAVVQQELRQQEAAAEEQHQQVLLAAPQRPSLRRSASTAVTAAPAPASAVMVHQGQAAAAAWVPAVLQRLKAIALDAERQHHRLQADLHIAQGEAALAHSRILGLETALAQRTADWEAAEAAKQYLVRASSKRLEQGVGHTAERLKLQVGRAACDEEGSSTSMTRAESGATACHAAAEQLLSAYLNVYDQTVCSMVAFALCWVLQLHADCSLLCLPALQEQRINSLTSQLEAVTQDLIAASVSSASAQAQLSKEQACSESLQTQLDMATAEAAALERRLHAQVRPQHRALRHMIKALLSSPVHDMMMILCLPLHP